MKKILITGGVGFIGTNLCLELLSRGLQVIAIDNMYTALDSNLEILKKHENFAFIRHNVIETIDIELLKDVDFIYHLACPASPPQYQKDPIFTMQTNVWGTFNVLELAEKINARVLIASTSEVYGDPEIHPQVESYRGNVNMLGIRANYDEGKRCAETLAMDFNRCRNVDSKIIRIFNTYGPHMDPKDGRVVSNFICQALKDEDITIYGDGTQTRSFQYIDDLITGMIKMMHAKDFIGPVNLGNPDEFTILELAQKILIAIPSSKSKIVYKPLPGDDPKQRKPDISLAKNQLNWEPQVKLESGLVKTIEYFKSMV